jgi:hypothetical protein
MFTLQKTEPVVKAGVKGAAGSALCFGNETDATLHIAAIALVGIIFVVLFGLRSAAATKDVAAIGSVNALVVTPTVNPNSAKIGA